MKEAEWVHFAYHGVQGAASLAEGLCLAVRWGLKLRNIIALSRPRGRLAFFSACRTAMGKEDPYRSGNVVCRSWGSRLYDVVNQQ